MSAVLTIDERILVDFEVGLYNLIARFTGVLPKTVEFVRWNMQVMVYDLNSKRKNIWRKVVRFGSVLFTISVLSWLSGGTLCWEQVSLSLSRYWAVTIDQNSLMFPRSREWIFGCLVIGPLAALLCSHRFATSDQVTRRMSNLAILFWIAGLILPVYFGIRRVLVENEWIFVLGWGLLLLYLLAGGLLFLNARNSENSPSKVFWLGILPISIAVVTMVADLTSSLQSWILPHWWSWSYLSLLQILTLPVLGVIGSVMMLVGWLNWWSIIVTSRNGISIKPWQMWGWVAGVIIMLVIMP